MKKSSYMTRAMQARDPRFATILGKLGYERSDMQAVPQVDEIKELRAEYQRVIGKRPFHGWSVDELREKIAKAQG